MARPFDKSLAQKRDEAFRLLNRKRWGYDSYHPFRNTNAEYTTHTRCLVCGGKATYRDYERRSVFCPTHDDDWRDDSAYRNPITIYTWAMDHPAFNGITPATASILRAWMNPKKKNSGDSAQ